jgi:hypothetical protein
MTKPKVTEDFEVREYVNEVGLSLDQHWRKRKGKITATAPATLEEHEAAEAFARSEMKTRIEGGPPMGVPTLDDGDDISVSAAVGEVRQWADDVIVDAEAWEKIATDLVAFRDKQKKAA